MAKNSDAIAALNDVFRRALVGTIGKVLITPGITALDEETRFTVIRAVQEFDSFDPDDDPYGEHDFGAFEVAGTRFFWKIDYYDTSMSAGSPDPADPSVTTRVLTIMRADEY